jgi:hypothetical protein
MKNLFIVPIEPIDQRYTAQWYVNIPKILNDEIQKRGILGVNVITIDGEQNSSGTTPGAFLDFAATNSYKASQIVKISELFQQGKVSKGDKFLVTDAWNFAITAIRYMSELLDVPVEIHSIWHAGCYDPSDILGMKMSNNWASNQERSWYYASDFNYFATNFHLQMFLKNLAVLPERAILSGQPHNLIIDEVESYNTRKKTNLVIFPHRLSSDKQPDIAHDLYKSLDSLMLVTQPFNLEKSKYYELLGRSKAVFSCALHENLGISVMEGVLAGAIPIVPDRCSYSEMYLPVFKYPSEWTSSYENYQLYKHELIKFIDFKVTQYHSFSIDLFKQRKILVDLYLKANRMVDCLLECKNE